MHQNNTTQRNFHRILQTTAALLSLSGNLPTRTATHANRKPNGMHSPRHGQGLDRAWADRKADKTPLQHAR